MKRLDVNDPQCFNKWRELYDDLTDQEHKDFLNDCEEKYPVQQHHTPKMYLDLIPPGTRVLEIGGWKGELAKFCLENLSLEGWLNLELCSNAINKSVSPISDTYFVLEPAHFDWFNKSLFVKSIEKLHPDVCISAHCIEHFSNEHLKQLISCIARIPLVIFEAPISEKSDDWTDYGGTHKLTMGWKGVTAAMESHGYSSRRENENCYVYCLVSACLKNS